MNRIRPLEARKASPLLVSLSAVVLGIIAGCVFILLVYPFFGYLVLLIPVTPRELMIGIASMCCSPTVLASSAILADQVPSLPSPDA